MGRAGCRSGGRTDGVKSGCLCKSPNKSAHTHTQGNLATPVPRMICVLRQDKCSLWPERLDACWICQHRLTLTMAAHNVKLSSVCVTACGALNSSSSSVQLERVNKTPDNAAYSEISWQHASYAQYSSSIVKLLCGRRTRRTIRATHTLTHARTYSHPHI